MDVTSPVYAVAAVLTAVATAAAISRFRGAPTAQGRYASIDGLRGYLAFFVFLHHSSIWYAYLHSGRWSQPQSHLFNHFGQASVAVFFMITAFLFFTKLLNGRERGIDWIALFVSRVLRLTPLYLFAMLLVFLTVAYLSGGALNVPVPDLLRGVLRWLSFTVLGAPDLNGVGDTWIIIAGVTWSLPYEWFFYLSLPVLALAIGSRPPLQFILLGVISVVCLVLWIRTWMYLMPFAGGIVAALAVRHERVCTLAQSRSGSILAIASVTAAVALFPGAYHPAPIALLTLAFTLVAGGASLFGALTAAASRTLGEMAYSLYLLHAIVLYLVFGIMLDEAETLSPAAHATIIIGITPIVVCLCCCTFSVIERPAMALAPGVSDWLRQRFTGGRHGKLTGERAA